MNRHIAVSLMLAAGGLCGAARVGGQGKTLDPTSLEVFNRTATRLSDGTRMGVRLNARADNGVAYLRGVEFGNGTIELDIRGKDVQGQSFVGVAFHGVDDTTYDAVYLRPFNFKTDDPVRHQHAVQYVSHPTYPWQELRAEHPGEYERAVAPAPDPNGWFHVRVVVASPKVSVFVADATEPSLMVTQLSDRRKGRVGLWVGNGSDGDFANLKIVAKE
jgi:hypothetical protein